MNRAVSQGIKFSDCAKVTKPAGGPSKLNSNNFQNLMQVKGNIGDKISNNNSKDQSGWINSNLNIDENKIIEIEGVELGNDGKLPIEEDLNLLKNENNKIQIEIHNKLLQIEPFAIDKEEKFSQQNPEAGKVDAQIIFEVIIYPLKQDDKCDLKDFPEITNDIISNKVDDEKIERETEEESYYLGEFNQQIIFNQSPVYNSIIESEFSNDQEDIVQNPSFVRMNELTLGLPNKENELFNLQSKSLNQQNIKIEPLVTNKQPEKILTDIKIKESNQLDINRISASAKNLILADDNLNIGKEVMVRMYPFFDEITDIKQQLKAEQELEADIFILENRDNAISTNLDAKNNSEGQKDFLSKDNFDIIIQQENEGKFDVAFRVDDFRKTENQFQSISKQVRLGISEVVNFGSTSSATKQITINLYPQTLGAVKVEILSQIGQDGASKIEAIKISADKHDTLMILEERRADLVKSLKEVMAMDGKETSLQFEMNQQQGKDQNAYFSSFEERENWMSKFIQSSDDENNTKIILQKKDDEYITRGVVTDDKVDLLT